VFYVGQTVAGFANRHHDHFRTYFTGAYSIYEPKAFAEGRLDKLYHGYAYRAPAWRHAIGFYHEVQRLIDPLMEHLSVMELFIAELPKDRRLQRRVETAMMQCVYATDGPDGSLLEPGLKMEPRFEEEIPIQVAQSPNGLLRGIPERFEA
jgi:hypothetical protein